MAFPELFTSAISKIQPCRDTPTSHCQQMVSYQVGAVLHCFEHEERTTMAAICCWDTQTSSKAQADGINQKSVSQNLGGSARGYSESKACRGTGNNDLHSWFVSFSLLYRRCTSSCCLGFPYPENIALSSHLESVVRLNGGIPATIGVLNGVAKIGFQPEELIELLESAGKESTIKLSRRDLGYICGLVPTSACYW